MLISLIIRSIIITLLFFKSKIKTIGPTTRPAVFFFFLLNKYQQLPLSSFLPLLHHQGMNPTSHSIHIHISLFSSSPKKKCVLFFSREWRCIEICHTCPARGSGAVISKWPAAGHWRCLHLHCRTDWHSHWHCWSCWGSSCFQQQHCPHTKVTLSGACSLILHTVVQE